MAGYHGLDTVLTGGSRSRVKPGTAWGGVARVLHAEPETLGVVGMMGKRKRSEAGHG